MFKFLSSHVVSAGLAIFSMFFGAGNLIYPMMVGITSGQNTPLGLAAFLITAVLLPFIGLISMILFDGNYENFFSRLGKIPGNIVIAICMIIIGPLIAIPRIVTLSHTMIAPFIPITFLQQISPLSSLIFALIFLGITFVCTYRESKIVNLLGNIVSPLLLISLAIIIIKGLIDAQSPVHIETSLKSIFLGNLIRGYETLDLLGGIFFSSIVITILKSTTEHDLRKLARLGLKSGLIGVSLLALVYIGMGLLSMYHGHGLTTINAGELFREISFRILGTWGALVIATAVFMACLSTAIALGAVVGEYTQKVIFGNRINFVTGLSLVLLASLPLCVYGLGYVLQLTGGVITYVGYPVLIALTLCNIAYKLVGFKPVKIPVLLTFIAALISYYW